MSPKIAAPNRRFVKLSAFLETNGIDALAYLRSLLRGDAPAPVLIDDEIFLSSTDLVAWQTRLQADAHTRALRIISGGADQ